MQAKPVQTPELPALPRLPARLSFREELAGRRAYLAARDATHAASGYSFQCALSVLRSDRGRVSPAVTATEILYTAPGNKLAVSHELGATGRRTVRKAICDGDSLLAVRFDERGKQTTREFSRLYLSELGQVSRALQYARLDPLGASCGAQLATEPEVAMLTRLWQAPDGTVLEASSLAPRAGRPQRIRRYKFTPTHNLSVAEEWEVRDGRTTYRKETYQPAPKNAAPFSQALPENYTEQPLKVPERPQEIPPAQLDPAAAALLAAWERAHQRYFTLHAGAFVTTQQQIRSTDSRPPRGGMGYNGTYDLWLERPDRALVTVKGIDGFPVTQSMKADAVQVVVEDSAGKKRPANVREGARLEQTLQQAALRSALDPLQWLLEGPPSLSGYDSVRALPATALPDGTLAESVLLTRTAVSNNRGDRRITSETSYRVWLGKDGLPRGFETTRKTSVEGYFERDQPPTTIITVRLNAVSTDREPPF